MIVLTPYINLLNLSWIITCLFLGNMEFDCTLVFPYIKNLSCITYLQHLKLEQTILLSLMCFNPSHAE